MIRVILIEDHDLTRVGIRAALQQREGFEVIGDARDAKSGLKLVKTAQPDVAIVDIGLPDFTGIELTQQFKQAQASGECPNTRILIMTMQDSEDTVLAAFAAGADSYCMKDASIDKLAQAIQTTAGGNAWIDPAIARVVLHQTQKVYSSNQHSPEPATISINRLADEDLVPAYPLTERELEVLKLIVDGCSNAQIAEKLYITVGTVKTHVRNILNKLCADDRTQVAVRALRTGLVQ
ncbi:MULTISPECIES: response regulator [Leptolyngbya]|jgi:DNA-binding NarL/FixJ family response regulator|uniref:LuxR family two component transcriptional regulator n=2 Tax=Leptolyngbya boryana TaxID=1184 RepID=A0A1Z4JL24_LEPBY|nr:MULTISPECIES: response regulator transcription factor [Leptolyngbya]BAY57297.1 LuxR family two component transcriptional regulator [Leptolyngbya boryana NIES-2135]MBD1857462.1 response regulator transcription factor [Leptolyngbya sp. FACHB-1624]MBD2366952.1 response regulator transcription factor [Leptolyngbya sp. FACHB-161]MBD2373694.1 response regulator transcription factor [Leptolyngbya sp. FACHB-238]MBD2398103.1 response regulator transcription factor [Leptolyngbya sp. FACHB-239]